MTTNRVDASVEVQDSGRVAPHLMEDAEPSREATALDLKLRESEARYRTLFDLVPVAAYACDSGGVIQSFNQRAAELWGREPAVGDTDERFCGSYKMFRADGTFMPHDQCPMAEVVSGKLSEVRDAEVKIERPDGSWITAVVNIRPLKNRQGEVTGAINCFYDITERKQAEAAQARLAAIVESSDDAIVSKDLNGIITSWNRGAEQLFGYTPDEAIGQVVTLLIPPDRLDEETAILERVRRAETVDHYDTVRRRKDGTLFDASITVSPIRDNQGKVVGASKIARNITERRRGEEALRTADRNKSEFLAMLGHELRNPLAPIVASIEVLRRSQIVDAFGRTGRRHSETPDDQTIATRLDPSGSIDQALKVLARQVGQMVRLVDDLLDAARINRGKIDLRKERVDVSSVVLDAVEVARPLCEDLKHELTVTLPSDPVFLNADPARLAQIVGNLLNNACKFTAVGGHIWLTVERGEMRNADHGDGEPGGFASQVVIRVRDTGIGILADQRGRVFDIFTQVDTSLERTSTGLGIGLAMVKALAELHGGTVEVISAGVNQGSEFVVRLPILVETDAHASPPRTIEPAVPSPLRILIVDDNRDSADMLARLLEFSGHETHTAHDGLAAVDAAANLQPDVIFLDISLPVLNGYEAARRIRDRQLDKRPLLVALTGWGQKDHRRRSEKAGFDAHLVKPVDDAVIERLLMELGTMKPRADSTVS
jgi:two-component system, chemotaxis family, CheB/CheR fusion protein